MLKRASIEDLFKQGKKAKEIKEITGFSIKYIYNILLDISNPGILAKHDRDYNRSPKGIEYNRRRQKSPKGIECRRKCTKKWRKNNKDAWSKIMKSNRIRHAMATRPNATNHRQEWTVREIEYLQMHGQTKTMIQIALHLGRTYSAINNAAQKYKIDMRGEKTKTPSSRVLAPQSPIDSLSVSTA